MTCLRSLRISIGFINPHFALFFVWFSNHILRVYNFYGIQFFSGILAEILSPLKLNYHKNSRLYFFVRKVINLVVNSANNYFSHYMQSYQKNKSKKGKKIPSEKPLLQFYFVWQKTVVIAFPRGFFSLYVMFIYTYVCFGSGEVHIVLRSILVKAEVGY